MKKLTEQERLRLFYRDKKVFITGGSSGIGFRLAEDLLELGAEVAILAHRQELVDKAGEALARNGLPVRTYCCDISDLAQVRHAVSRYVSERGAPDILVNCAGYAVYHAFPEMPSEEIHRLGHVNFIGACLITREFLPGMIMQRKGNIVVMASIAGRLVMTPCGMYSAAKHGLIAWAETLRFELARYGLSVNIICPGRVETGFFDHPSFRSREQRKETRWVIPVQNVSAATLGAVRKGRRITYIPRFYAFGVWLYNAFPFVFKRLLDRLMLARVRSLPATQDGPGR